MFAQKFDRYVCDGDTITTEEDGFDITARVVYDETSHIDDDDCHNTDTSVTGCNPRQQKKLIEARRAWFNNEWFYCGIVLSVEKNGIVLDENAASLWGIEANYPTGKKNPNAYLTEVANELLPEAVKVGKEAMARLLS